MKEANLIYPELSYKIIGAAFDIYNELGWGHDERVYQSAFCKALSDLGLKFEKEKYIPINFKGTRISKKFLDFVIDDKIVLEFKIAPRLGYVHINQVVSYLKSANLELAILVYFLQDGVRFKRIVNLKN